MCGGSGGNPLLAKCASTAMNIAGLGAPNLPAGWKHDVGEDGATVLVMPPPGHPFWRSADVARQTSAMFQQLGAEKDALASELATTLVRHPPGYCAPAGGRVAGSWWSGGAPRRWSRGVRPVFRVCFAAHAPLTPPRRPRRPCPAPLSGCRTATAS